MIKGHTQGKKRKTVNKVKKNYLMFAKEGGWKKRLVPGQMACLKKNNEARIKNAQWWGTKRRYIM